MTKAERQKVINEVKDILTVDNVVWDDYDRGGANDFQIELSELVWFHLEKSLNFALDRVSRDIKLSDKSKLKIANREIKQLKEALSKYEEIEKVFEIKAKV